MNNLTIYMWNANELKRRIGEMIEEYLNINNIIILHK